MPGTARPVRRVAPRLRSFDYASAGAYFVTSCAWRRQPLFGGIVEGRACPTEAGRLVRACWEEIPRRHPGVEVDAFVVMPNHVHGLLWLPAARPTALPRVVGGFKAAVSRELRRRWCWPALIVWQRGFWERVVRTEAELGRVREYIRTNPQRWCSDPENPACVEPDEEERWLRERRPAPRS